MDPTRTSPETTPEPSGKQPSPRRGRLYRIPVLGAIAYVVWPPRTKPASLPRRIVSWVAAVVAVFGIGMVAYPWFGQSYPGFFRTPVEKLIAWSNFLSDMEANKIQDRLASEFAAIGDIGDAKDGDPITRLIIPKLGVDTIVVEGTSPSALKAGAGHYPQTPLPGSRGNVAIAGHRTTYGRPFNQVHRLEAGDRVILITPVGKFTYELTKNPWITSPYDWSVIDPSKKPLLTLTTCNPMGSASERLIARAKLVKTEPLDGAGSGGKAA